MTLKQTLFVWKPNFYAFEKGKRFLREALFSTHR
nr:MAG TPA: hypothetical protein [Caudoviricetes sp.]